MPSEDEALVVKTLPTTIPAKSKRIDPVFIDDETAYKLEKENK